MAGKRKQSSKQLKDRSDARRGKAGNDPSPGIAINEAHLLAALMDSVTDHIYFKDKRSRFILINRSQARLFGLKDPADAVGKTDFDFFTDDHASKAMEDERRVILRREPIIGKEEMETWPDGHVSWVSSTKMPLYDENGEVVGSFGISRDITRRKEMEARLEESEARMRTLIELAPDIIYRVDSEGTILFVSRAVEEVLGYPPEDLVGKCLLDLVHPNDIEKCRKRIAEHNRGRRSARALEIRMKRKGVSRGRKKPEWVHVSVSSRGIWDVEARNSGHGGSNRRVTEGIIRDITERKRAEDELLRYREGLEALVATRTAELQKSNERLQTEVAERKRVAGDLRKERDKAQLYLDIAGAIIVVLDARGRIALLNRSGSEMLGYDEEEILGKDWFSLCLPPDQQDNVRSVFRKLMAGESELFEYHENEIVTKNGETRIVAWHNRLLQDEKGTPTGTLSAGEDITQRKRAEEALLQTERLEAVGSVARGVAENFNNILNMISGNASSIAAHFVPESPVHASARGILDATRQAGEMTRGLLRLAHASASRKETRTEPVGLSRLVSEVVDFLEPSFREKEVRVRIVKLEEMPFVYGDSGLLFDVLVALGLNAAEAMPEGGAITFDCSEKLVTTPNPKLNPEAEGGRYVILRIRDTGAGIPREDLPHVFEPFYTTKTSKSGFGMGLTYVQSVIRSMGGWTAVRSTEGKGTSIRLFLPKARIARVRRGRAETRGQTVLVVDDKAEILSAVKKSLEQAGYKVLTADNAEDGLLLYRKHSEDISLSIVDAVMKGQWGDVVVREIVTHRPEANVIMTSGFSQDYVRGLLPLGAWSFLQKPFTGEQLISAIREIAGSG